LGIFFEVEDERKLRVFVVIKDFLVLVDAILEVVKLKEKHSVEGKEE
jgi:hypothetical protein